MYWLSPEDVVMQNRTLQNRRHVWHVTGPGKGRSKSGRELGKRSIIEMLHFFSELDPATGKQHKNIKIQQTLLRNEYHQTCLLTPKWNTPFSTRRAWGCPCSTVRLLLPDSQTSLCCLHWVSRVNAFLHIEQHYELSSNHIHIIFETFSFLYNADQIFKEKYIW